MAKEGVETAGSQSTAQGTAKGSRNNTTKTGASNQSGMLEEADEKNEKINYYMGMANAASKIGDEANRNLNLRKAGREEDAAKKFLILSEKTENLYIILDKMKKYSGIMVEDIAHEIEIKKEEREVIRTSHSTMKSAVNIINGN